jgi:hypothetical protein
VTLSGKISPRVSYLLNVLCASREKIFDIHRTKTIDTIRLVGKIPASVLVYATHKRDVEALVVNGKAACFRSWEHGAIEQSWGWGASGAGGMGHRTPAGPAGCGGSLTGTLGFAGH